MGEFSPWHLLILAGVFVLLFGARRLPDGARALGRSLRIFKTEVKGLHDDEPAQAPPAATASLPPGTTSPSTTSPAATSPGAMPPGAMPPGAMPPPGPPAEQVQQSPTAADRDAR